jgi:hypothetical protein
LLRRRKRKGKRKSDAFILNFPFFLHIVLPLKAMDYPLQLFFIVLSKYLILYLYSTSDALQTSDSTPKKSFK